MSTFLTEPATMPASEIKRGDYLAGLDHGYVVEVERGVTIVIQTGRMPVALGGESYVTFTFHDRNGDEGYLTIPADMPVSVSRERGNQ